MSFGGPRCARPTRREGADNPHPLGQGGLAGHRRRGQPMASNLIVRHGAMRFLGEFGVRDEAKLLADYGDCGKPVCCNTHMTTMPPVSMRMAKLQKSTLDPSKISGRCGRLKCCLRFEQDVYEEFQAELPPVGTRVLTAKGQGRVLAQEILARRVLIEVDDGRRIVIPVQEILTRLG